MPSEFAALGERLARLVVEHGAPSLAVAIVRDGTIAWEAGFGWADRAQRRAATAHTPYSLASITKPITAAALMSLVRAGLVDLDAPIDDHLGGARIEPYAPGDVITVRHVAAHTAGLPLHYQFFYEDEPYRPPPRPETIRRYAVASTPPGERFLYSNLGYGVLDHLITEVSGLPYADVVREVVLEPLGMSRSSVHLDAATSTDAALRYGADGVAYPFYDFDHPGGSAVFASAQDLLRFAIADLDAPEDGRHDPIGRSPAGFGYGIGWMSHPDEAGFATRGHTGGMGGVATVMALVPSERIAVVVLSNSSGQLPQQVRVEVLSALLPAYAARRDEAEALLLGGAAAGEGVRPPADVVASLAGVWDGEIETYEGVVPLHLDVRPDGDVHARVGRQFRTLVNRLRWDGRRLTGAMFGDLGTEDARRRLPHHLLVDLRPREGGVLDGTVTAMSDVFEGEGGAPGRRVGNALSHRVRLARAPG